MSGDDGRRSEPGWRFLPGGTREPGESLNDLARRELMEEAGAQLTSPPRYFAAHIADSQRPAPYRPHQPHPRACWAYAVAHAQVVAPPVNPPDGEQVIEVRTMAPSQRRATSPGATRCSPTSSAWPKRWG